MNVTIGSRWEEVIAEAIESGRYVSAEDVVADGLRHVAEQQAKFRWLKEKLERSVEEGGAFSDDEVEAFLEERFGATAQAAE